MFSFSSLFVLINLGFLVAQSPMTYEIWKVPFESTPSAEFIELFSELERDAQIDVLRLSEKSAEFRVFEGFEESVKSFLRENSLQASIKEYDLEEHLSETRAKRQTSSCTSTSCETLPEDEYLTYAQIEAYLQGIAAANPDRVTTTDIGKSYEGRSIWMVTIKDGTDPTERSLLAEAGIHAREWISPAVALYFIDMLIKHPEITNGVEFRIFPVLNPDGYVYSHTDERLWRKNRRINSNSRCRGVDLNRNWSYEWGGKGSSSNTCSNTYRGTSAFSEPETTAVSNAMLNTPNVKLVLSIHSYSQLMLYPYAYDYVLPPLYLRYVSIRYTLAIEGFSGFVYEPQQATDLYPAAGITSDWAFATLGADYAYTLELRDTGDNGFVLPSSQIKPTREENWEGFKYLIQIVKAT